MAVRRKSTTLILVGVLVFILGGVGVLVVLTRGNSPKPSTVATQPTAGAPAPASSTSGNVAIGASSLKIPSGDVAVSIGLTSTEAVGGFPIAGDRLDIYATLKGQAGHISLPAPLAKLVLSNVEVLSIQEPIPSSSPASTVVELAVTPAQAEGLIYLTTFEGLYTALVPPGSSSSPVTPGRSASNILAPAS